jgi:hypothetical protein
LIHADHRTSLGPPAGAECGESLEVAPICRVRQWTRTVPSRNPRPQVVTSSSPVTEGSQQRTAGAGDRAAAFAASTP